MLTFKLALSNLTKSWKSFAPFILATVTMFVMLFTLTSIMDSPSIHKLKGADSVAEIMSLGFVVLLIFAAIIIIYSYRFLQLQRSREFGLYDILGLGKSKIMQVAFFELVLSYILTIILGTIIGIALSKFLFLIFVNLIGGNYFNLEIAPSAIVTVSAVFGILFLILVLIAGFIIKQNSSLELLKEASKGEREPKGNIILAILGLIFLIAGYIIAISVKNPVEAIMMFFIAVLLVIVGTYLFYISFTVWYLKWRKKQKSYYKSQNFITISSMLYRMKQNAAGLANITVLLSMTFVTLVVTVGIFAGLTNVVDQQFPREAQITAISGQSRESLQEKVQQAAVKSDSTISHLTTIAMTTDILTRTASNGNVLNLTTISGSLNRNNLLQISMTTQDDLVKLGNASSNLTAGQIAVYDYSGSTKAYQNIDFYGQKFKIEQHLKTVKNLPVSNNVSDSSLIVFANDADYSAALKAMNEGQNFSYGKVITSFFDIKPSKAANMENQFPSNGEITMTTRTEMLQNGKQAMGGFLFIGFVLGISFILGAALIIYYKQLSEGTQDKRSFKILQEVGLSPKEVRQTIRSQVKIMFFLPIVVAIIHFGFAYIMVSKLIELFGINDKSLILITSVIVIAAVAAIYYLIYKATSRVYYKIVER